MKKLFGILLFLGLLPASVARADCSLAAVQAGINAALPSNSGITAATLRNTLNSAYACFLSLSSIPLPQGKQGGLSWGVTGLYPEPIPDAGNGTALNTTIRFGGGSVVNGSNQANPALWTYIGRTDTDFRHIGLNGIDTCAAHVDLTVNTTSSNIASLSTGGTGPITVVSTNDFEAPSYVFLKVDGEYIKANKTNATTFTVTDRHQGFTTAASHSNGSTLSLIVAQPACDPAIGPPITVDTAWYLYAIWDGGSDPANNVGFLWSQSEIGNSNPSNPSYPVQYPLGYSDAFFRGMTFGIVFRASCNVGGGSTGIPQFVANSWPYAMEYYFSNTNNDGCYDVLASTAGTGNQNFANVLGGFLGSGAMCPNQFQRSALLNVRTTVASGAGSVFLRALDTSVSGENIINVGAANQLPLALAVKQNLGAGDHYRAGQFQWAANSALSIAITAKGCGSVTQ